MNKKLRFLGAVSFVFSLFMFLSVWLCIGIGGYGSELVLRVVLLFTLIALTVNAGVYLFLGFYLRDLAAKVKYDEK